MTQAIISLTPAAYQHIAGILAKHDAGAVFRLSVKHSGCSGLRYHPDIVPSPESADIEIQNDEGVPVFVDAAASKMLAGTVLDIVTSTLNQRRLVFRNPNAEAECGCGESFNLKVKE